MIRQKTKVKLIRKPHTKATRAKIALSLKGKLKTPETRKRMRRARRKYLRKLQTEMIDRGD